MDNNQITALAREYADEECNKSTMIDTSNLYEDKRLEFYDVYCFLLRRYCLVSKRKAKQIHYLSMEAYNRIEDIREKSYFMGKLNTIEDLIPEIAKEVEG